jgi:hypothetical protein
MDRLAQLMPILKSLDLYQVDCVVAGGFANFLWTERYAAHDSRYATHAPFVDQDLDLIGDRDEAMLTAQALSVKPERNSDANSVTFLASSADGRSRLRINVLTTLCGIDYPEAFASAQMLEFPDGFAAKVLDPFLCLQNKALNLLIPDQATHNDQHHARFAVLNLENRVKELLSSELPGIDREILHLAERTFRLALSDAGQRILREHGIALEGAIPTALFSEKCGKLAKFSEERLPKLEEKLIAKRVAGVPAKHGKMAKRLRI